MTDGGSIPPSSTTTTEAPTTTDLFSVGDWNGDGANDLAARKPDGKLYVYLGNDAGNFVGSYQIGQGWGMFTELFSPGDWNGDGHADIIGRTAQGTLLLYPGNGSGGWNPGLGQTIGWGWASMKSIAGAGDFNGDGNNDVAYIKPNGTLWIYRGNGLGGWSGNYQIGSGGWTTFENLL